MAGDSSSGGGGGKAKGKKGFSSKKRHSSDADGKAGSKSRSKEKRPPQKSVGLCAKAIFFILLSTFSLTATVIFVDYHPGQLKEAYEKNIPPEVRKLHLKIIKIESRS